MGMREVTKEVFWSLVDKSGGEDACWPWTRHRSSRGYGEVRAISIHKGPTRAHRAAYIFEYGDFDRSLFVCHKCDNPPCCNPKHLFLGDRFDNAQDKARKGRGRKQNGEMNHMAKFEEFEIHYIRETKIHSTLLARAFGVNRRCIERIRTGQRWGHIPPPVRA